MIVARGVFKANYIIDRLTSNSYWKIHTILTEIPSTRGAFHDWWLVHNNTNCSNLAVFSFSNTTDEFAMLSSPALPNFLRFQMSSKQKSSKTSHVNISGPRSRLYRVLSRSRWSTLDPAAPNPSSSITSIHLLVVPPIRLENRSFVKAVDVADSSWRHCESKKKESRSRAGSRSCCACVVPTRTTRSAVQRGGLCCSCTQLLGQDTRAERGGPEVVERGVVWLHESASLFVGFGANRDGDPRTWRDSGAQSAAQNACNPPQRVLGGVNS